MTLRYRSPRAFCHGLVLQTYATVPPFLLSLLEDYLHDPAAGRAFADDERSRGAEHYRGHVISHGPPRSSRAVLFTDRAMLVCVPPADFPDTFAPFDRALPQRFASWRHAVDRDPIPLNHIDSVRVTARLVQIKVPVSSDRTGAGAAFTNIDLHNVSPVGISVLAAAVGVARIHLDVTALSTLTPLGVPTSSPAYLLSPSSTLVASSSTPRQLDRCDSNLSSAVHAVVASSAVVAPHHRYRPFQRNARAMGLPLEPMPSVEINAER